MITALDHIAIAVPDLEGAIARFLEDFGALLFRGAFNLGGCFVASFDDKNTWKVLQLSAVSLCRSRSSQYELSFTREIEAMAGGASRPCGSSMCHHTDLLLRHFQYTKIFQF